jgi:hypothetical protein
MDVAGKQRKPEGWTALTDGQCERLEDVGIVPHPELVEPGKAPVAGVSAFERRRPRAHRGQREGRHGGQVRGTARAGVDVIEPARLCRISARRRS